MRRKRTLPNNSPFANWLIEQADKYDTTLTELGRRAGLSTGTLRGLTAVPNRQPSLNTCLRLARTLDTPYEEVLKLAGLSLHLPNNTNRNYSLPPAQQAKEKGKGGASSPLRRAAMTCAR